MSTKENDSTAVIGFKSGALPDDEARCRGFIGREAISQLFEFYLVISRPEPYTSAEIDKVLLAPASLAMGGAEGERIHGVIRSIEHLDSTRTTHARYLMKLVPTAWLLTLGRTSRIFQNMSVPELVSDILTQYGLASGTDFLVKKWTKSPTREYAVQHEESDWAFVQRWLEHEGYSYWFEHGERDDTLVIGHQSTDAPMIQGEHRISFRERNNLDHDRHSIFNWRVRHHRVPARAVLVDYDYQRPVTRIVAKAPVDPSRGFGTVFYAGQLVPTKDDGEALVQIRAERLACQREIAHGESNCPRLRVGHRFLLEDHHVDGHDDGYLVTTVEHSAGQVPGATDGQGIQPYRARFEAVRADKPYRPPLRTPKPRIDGVIQAHIDADGSGDVGEIDAQGRYRVKMPFDGSTRVGSKASLPVPMAQHYAGAGYGSHFPLHRGAEVLVAHLDGDPDRPVIVAASPNPRTLTPSTSANATQSVIHTHSGIRIELEDRQG